MAEETGGISPEEEARVALISEIMQKDREAFTQWTENPLNKERLDIPPTVLRHLIPRRIFDLSDDPKNVQVAYGRDASSDNLPFFVYERKASPATPPEPLVAFLSLEEDERTLVSEEPDAGDAFIEEYGYIDPFHLAHPELLLDGTLTAYDYIMLDVGVQNSYAPDALDIVYYIDREELQRKGVGTSFYTNLRSAAKDMGFRFITGQDNEDNISFFTDTLGRTPLSSIKSGDRSHFLPLPDDLDQDTCTVDFLYPEDKEKYTSARTLD